MGPRCEGFKLGDASGGEAGQVVDLATGNGQEQKQIFSDKAEQKHLEWAHERLISEKIEL